MKRAAAVWLIIVVLLAAFPVAAEISFEQVSWTVTEKEVQINGTISSGGVAVSVVILRPGYRSLQEGNLRDSCIYLKTVQTGQDGTFSVSAALPRTGEYPMILTAQGAQYRDILLWQEGAAAQTIYIAPNGSDEEGFGTAAAPFASFNKALQAAQSRLELADVDIVFCGGTYAMQESCVVLAEQGGKNGHHLRIRAEEGKDVQLQFARTITGWENCGNGVWCAPLPQGADPDSIYENGVLAVPARSPNRKEQENQYVHSAAMDHTKPNEVFYMEAGQFPQIKDTRTLEVFLWPGGINGHYNWSTQLIAVEAYDADTGRVELARKATYEIGAGSRYYLQGAMEFLDAPGEFYADTTAGKLYYRPYDSASLEAGIAIPMKADAFRLEGTEKRPIENVTVEGLSISGVDAPGCGIRLIHAAGCTIDSCQIGNIGYRGITVEGVSKKNTVIRNHVAGTGSDGIAVTGKTYVPEKVSYGNQIANNLVEQVGWCDGNAGGIRIYDSAENVIRHNRVNGSPRYGIHLKGIPRSRLLGNTYGGVSITEDNFRDYQKTKDNLIEANDISNVVQDSQDCGAIATWGVNTGNIIRGNWIHDCMVDPITILPERTFVFGIYMDEDSDGVLVENNIISGMNASGGAQVMGLIYPRGTGIIIQNNLMVQNGSNSVFVYNDTYDTSGGIYGCGQLVFRHNVAVNCGTCLYTFQDKWTPDKILQADENLFWQEGGQPSVSSSSPLLKSWQGWKELGFDNKSVWSQLTFLEGEDNYRPDTQGKLLLEKMGIHLWSHKEMGLEKDFPFAKEGLGLRHVFIRTGETVDGPGRNLLVGEHTGIEISWRDIGGFLHSIPVQQAQINSSNPEIAAVENGILRAKQPGSTSLNISCEIGGQRYTTSYQVIVQEEVELGFETEQGGQPTNLQEGNKICAYAQFDSGILMLAIYRGNELTSVAIRDLSQQGAGTTEKVTVPQGATRALAMIWNTMDEMRPVCSPAVLEE